MMNNVKVNTNVVQPKLVNVNENVEKSNDVYCWYEYPQMWTLVYLPKTDKLMPLKKYVSNYVVCSSEISDGFTETQHCARLPKNVAKFIRDNLICIDFISTDIVDKNLVHVNYNLNNTKLNIIVADRAKFKKLLQENLDYITDKKLFDHLDNIEHLDINTENNLFKISEIFDEDEYNTFVELEQSKGKVNTTVNTNKVVTEKEKIAKSTVPHTSLSTKKEKLRTMLLSSIKSKSVLYTKDTKKEELVPEVNGTTVVFAKNGVFEIVKTRVGIFSVLVQQLNIPQKDLVDFEQKDEWFIPKPTLADLMKLVEIDKHVYLKTKAEFYANLMWDVKQQKYVIEIPEQTISGASVEFKPIIETDDKFTVIDHHSHNTMSSFFSGIDDANDIVRFKLAIVIGNIDKGFTVASRKVVNGVFQKVDQSDLFEDKELSKTLNKIDKMFDENKITAHNPVQINQVSSAVNVARNTKIKYNYDHNFEYYEQDLPDLNTYL